ncbi:MAG: hypothetical protein LBG77_08645, partial [Dysgonamonadaceae bacterium]|nr:hypothetical protein [Dysgonamonadaceae bacterium]
KLGLNFNYNNYHPPERAKQKRRGVLPFQASLVLSHCRRQRLSPRLRLRKSSPFGLKAKSSAY